MAAEEPHQRPDVSLGRIAALFLRLGTIGFGGPTAHIALMQEELVTKRRWVSHQRFMDALGVTNLVPGPNSSELAIHTGYLLRGHPGALVAGVSFLLPALVIMTGLSALYFGGGGFGVRDDLFAGLQPVVIAVLAATLWRLRSAVAGWLPLAIAAAVATLTVVVPGWEPVWLIASGFVTLAVSAPEWRGAAVRDERGSARGGLLAKLAAVATGASALPALGWVFLKTGALMFGGGYVLIPLLQPEVIARGWLTESQFLDGIALGQATPGPISTSSAFVGYGVSGVAGAVVATVAIYVPAFLVVMAGTGPFLRAFQTKPWLRHFTRGVNAAAIGAIAGAGIALAPTALGSPLRASVCVVAAAALFAKVPIWVVLPAGAAVGLAAGALGWT